MEGRPKSRSLRYDIHSATVQSRPSSVRLYSPNRVPYSRMGGGGGLAGLGLVPRGTVPSPGMTRSHDRIGDFQRDMLETCLEAWSSAFFACGVRWVKFPCFGILGVTVVTLAVAKSGGIWWWGDVGSGGVWCACDTIPGKLSRINCHEWLDSFGETGHHRKKHNLANCLDRFLQELELEAEHGTSKVNLNWTFGIPESHNLTWKPILIGQSMLLLPTAVGKFCGFNFMNTKIYIDNESTICIVKNPVFHSKTKHIEIRHHFIRDAYEKKLIQVLKIHTDDNVVDLLTKAFDVSRFNFLIVNIGMLNL
ncbi:hypothetical protein Tco_1449151 [Tanacetum coccineum]